MYSNLATKNISYTIIMIILTSIVYSCEQEESAHISDEIGPYMDRFIEEGALRGYEVVIDYKRLSASVSSISGSGVIGQCVSYSNESQEILISAEFWNSASELNREFLVFHEMGHCILDRSHDDRTDHAGRCLSIMNSGSTNCRNLYNTTTRSDFIDELFN